MNLFIPCLIFLSGSQANIFESKLTYSSADDIIGHINAKATTWRAGLNFGGNFSLTDMRKKVGTLLRPRHQRNLPVVSHTNFDIKQIPESFDARVKWPECNSTSEIRNQGTCISDWAFSAVEVMTDRQCIHSNGTQNFHYSANDVLSCCSDCGRGCLGGYIDDAFDYWIYQGIVSGGPYRSHEGCSSYSIPDDGNFHKTPKCTPKCEEGYEFSYKEDLHYGEKSYSVAPGEENMMKELYINGPVTAIMKAYEDFFYYHSGVYKHYSIDLVGEHAIKIIGYGEENGIKYWLCSNSWGDIFGEKGFFRILRGVNECGIESKIHAGLPKLE